MKLSIFYFQAHSMGLLGPAMPDRLPPPATPPLPLLWATAITTRPPPTPTAVWTPPTVIQWAGCPSLGSGQPRRPTVRLQPNWAVPAVPFHHSTVMTALPILLILFFPPFLNLQLSSSSIAAVRSPASCLRSRSRAGVVQKGRRAAAIWQLPRPSPHGVRLHLVKIFI